MILKKENWERKKRRWLEKDLLCGKYSARIVPDKRKYDKSKERQRLQKSTILTEEDS